MHAHNHNPAHTEITGNPTRAFVIGIILNVGFVVVEFFYGYVSHSLSLIADAWHNLGDVAGLAISLLALRMASMKPNSTYTYGFSKGTILASLANCVLLLIAVGSIGYEAFQRFLSPQKPEWETISVVAGIGIVINTATALLFLRSQELNSRAAFLHMAADALVSVSVVVAGFLIYLTNMAWIDPVVSLIICIVILLGTWRVLKSSIRLSLDGVPETLDLNEIRNVAAEFPEIKDMHHLHVWALSTTKNAMTAHILLHSELNDNDLASLKSGLKHKLSHLNIQHVTLEVETKNTEDLEECNDC